MRIEEQNRKTGPDRTSIMPLGVSVVICCHNSESRIAETLACLQEQQQSESIQWEVVLVDNSSTDETASIASSQWEKNPVTTLRVVTEEKLGLSHARLKGVAESRFEIISFIDDDNRVNHDWICQLPDLFLQNPKMAAVGGLVLAEFEANEPAWFQEFEAYYAVGPQALLDGKLDEYKGYLCGAGLTVRKSLLDCLFLNGFQFELVGRQGKNLLCSEDLELCLALQLAGWELHYHSGLQMRHFMPQARLDWDYLRRLSRGVGISATGITPYYIVKGGTKRGPWSIWIQTTVHAILSTLKYSFRKLSCLGEHGVGKADDLTFERCVGYLYGLIARRWKFTRSINKLRGLNWKACAPCHAQNSTSDNKN